MKARCSQRFVKNARRNSFEGLVIARKRQGIYPIMENPPVQPFFFSRSPFILSPPPFLLLFYAFSCQTFLCGTPYVVHEKRFGRIGIARKIQVQRSSLTGAGDRSQDARSNARSNQRREWTTLCYQLEPATFPSRQITTSPTNAILVPNQADPLPQQSRLACISSHVPSPLRFSQLPLVPRSK